MLLIGIVILLMSGHVNFQSRNNVLAASMADDTADNPTDTQESFSPLDDILKGKTEVEFQDIYNALKSGDVDGALRLAVKSLRESATAELAAGKKLAIQIIAVIVLGSTFAQLSGNMGKYVSENGFLVTYMILVSLLLGDFIVVQSVVNDAVGDVVDFMKAFYPMYAASMLYVKGTETAAYSQSVIILIIYVCQTVVLSMVIPLVKCSGIISLVNNLGTEDYFSRLAELMRSIASWMLKMMFAVITGINVVKCMIAPSMDKISRNGVLKTIAKMSGMGSVNAVAGVIVSTGEFIKNCMGMTAAIVISILAAVPMVKILVIMFTLKCIAALIQPIGDKRYADGVAVMAQSVELMLKVCGISVLMCIISIAIMTMGT